MFLIKLICCQLTGHSWRGRVLRAALRTGVCSGAVAVPVATETGDLVVCRRLSMAELSGCDAGGADTGSSTPFRRGSSVSELVRTYDDGAGKRHRSESGDSMSAPIGKRRPPDSSPRQTTGEVKELTSDAVEGIESRLSLFLSRELHDFKESLQSKFDALHARIKDHVKERDRELEKISTELKKTREEVKQLAERSENNEMNSRIQCLIFSGTVNLNTLNAFCIQH